MNELEVAWLAGFLEGEGFFGLQKQPNVREPTSVYARIGITSTDRDVLEHVRSLIGGGSISGPMPVRKATHTPTHQYSVTGQRALDTMVSVLPLMHGRRALRIRELLEEIRRWSAMKRLRQS